VQVGHVRRAQAAATAQASAVRNDPATNPNGDDAR
jgi:hypothetical protein